MVNESSERYYRIAYGTFYLDVMRACSYVHPYSITEFSTSKGTKGKPMQCNSCMVVIAFEISQNEIYKKYDGEKSKIT